ncbi:MAG: hypothetical protein FWG49_06850, partial [Leptospirales bacterium]|nr:hypothetical protein [Leptospirales bacterium]
EAVDISVGATTWYAWWDSGLVRKKMTDIDTDPAFLYGPALSVKFTDDFNLTFIYLYGKFDSDVLNAVGGAEFKEKSKMKRNDSDLALNYRLNDYLKIFAGVKYMNFEYSTRIHVSKLSFDPNDDFDIDVDHSGIGPGLGLSAVYPIADNLFLIGTLSGFYLWGNEDEKNAKMASLYPDWNIEYKFKEYGFNSTLQLAYYIAEISTTITLGGRYQYLKTDYDYNKEDDVKYQRYMVEKCTHKFYGATLTATYSFNI